MHIIKYMLPSYVIVLVQKCVISKGFYDVIIKKENSFIIPTLINQQHKNPIKLDAFAKIKYKKYKLLNSNLVHKINSITCI